MMPPALHAHHWMKGDLVLKNTTRSLHLRRVDKEVSAVISRETGGNDQEGARMRWNRRTQIQ